jgi:hypothetical protein
MYLHIKTEENLICTLQIKHDEALAQANFVCTLQIKLWMKLLPKPTWATAF